MRGVAILLAALMASSLAGCTAPATKSEDLPPTGAVVIVPQGDGSTVSINVSEENGALLGQVVTDEGLPLRGARITVWGADEPASTNETGWFQLPEIPPGKRAIRVEYEGFQPAESEVEIFAGKATQVSIIMVPLGDVGAGYRPHIHDYWGGQTEMTVIDAKFDWDEVGPWYGYDKAWQAVSSQCFSDANYNNRPIFFNDPGQVVLPGTGTIEVTMTWTDQDFARDQMAIAWRPADATRSSVSPLIKRGVPFQFPVLPNQTDSGHQRYSLWQFHLCPYPQTLTEARAPVMGGIQVNMKIIRSPESILPEPAHPGFWNGGTELSIIAPKPRTFGPDYYSEQRSSRGNGGAFGFVPAAGTIVPPGAKELRVKLEWKHSPDAVAEPWGLSFRPANIAPVSTSDPATLEKVAADSTTATSRSYVIPLKSDMTDAYYQKVSSWMFYVSWEGEESERLWYNKCACTASVTVTAVAVKDSSYSEE